MSTKFFNGFTETIQVKQAANKYDFYPFVDVLEEARSGNSQALMYLVAVNIKAISYAFKKYHSFSKDFVNNLEEENQDFFNKFYMHLIEATNRGTGPIHSFNAAVFDNQESGFLMTKFGYRLFRYAQFVLVQDIKHNKTRRQKEITSCDFNSAVAIIDKRDTEPFENLEDTSVLVLDLSSEFIELVRRSSNEKTYFIFTQLMEGKSGPEPV
jgi:hypothetical protein